MATDKPVIYAWTTLSKDNRGYATLERMPVEGGALYRTTTLSAPSVDAWGNARDVRILAQQVTFAPVGAADV